MQDEVIRVELDNFVKSAKKHIKGDWPETVARAFSKIASDANSKTIVTTRNKFRLHSEYIPRGIKFYPQTEAQLKISADAMRRFGDMQAAVYLRGARDPKKSLQFMVDHELSEKRKPQNKWIAAPTDQMKRQYSSFKTSSGKIRKRYQPKIILERFRKTGKYNGVTTISHHRVRRRRLPGTPFLIYSRKVNKTFIAVRYYKGLPSDKSNLFMYVFLTKASIKKRWGFEFAVRSEVTTTYKATLADFQNRMPSYK
jgi:hypothetical protein